MKTTAQEANTTEQDCKVCDGVHEVTVIDLGGHIAVQGDFCPEGIHPEGDDDDETCDRCDAVLSGGKGMLITHPDPPSGDFLSVCDRCAQEVTAGATF